MDTTVKTKIYASLVLAILVLVPFHALLSVWLGTTFGYELFWKGWKELVLVGLGAFSIYIFFRRPDIWRTIISRLVNQLILAFAALHFVLALIFSPPGQALLAGLAIDLRFFAMFFAAQIAVLLWPGLEKKILKIVVWTGAVVVGFGLLQIFVLPDDFLRVFGYSRETIAPFLTVDQNPLFVRINSTLRGPNPLGAYAVILLSLLLAWTLQKNNWRKIWPWLASLGLLIVLFGTHGRAAWLAAITAVVVIIFVAFRRRLTASVIAGFAVGFLVVLGGLYLARDTYFVQNVIVHKNPDDPVGEDSNEGHLLSLQGGFVRALEEPFGRGPGSTGSASLHGDTPNIVENQFLFVAHESGWLGVGLFVAICVLLAKEFYQRAKNDWVVLGLLASLIGLSVVGILLPVWADDTVALVWWGLAGAFLQRQK